MNCTIDWILLPDETCLMLFYKKHRASVYSVIYLLQGFGDVEGAELQNKI